jgi:fucose permease
MMQFTYTHTRKACYLGYVCGAIINNFTPLLFVTFQKQFNVSLGHLALLISINFGVQLLVDMAAVHVVDRIGYRAAALAASAFSAAGLLAMSFFPFVLPNPYTGLLLAVVINAAGGGLLEVIISPIVEALPSNNKCAAMSLLHSFYCWGYVAVILLSTLYFTLAGIQRWRYLAMLWMLPSLVNIFLFSVVPLKTLVVGNASAVPLRVLLGKKNFLLLFFMMICAGASEQAMSQWSSYFAEAGLGVSKTLGDILGPCAFAVLMGGARVFFGLWENQLKLERILLIAGILCVTGYLITVFSPFPLLSLAGCAICGLSSGSMWPGIFSLASRIFPRGGTAMFAVLALAGDGGCGSGPGLVGMVMNRYSLNTGLLAAVIFPVLLVLGIGFLKTAGETGDKGTAMVNSKTAGNCIASIDADK